MSEQLNSQKPQSEEPEEELLEALPDGYMDTFDFLFEDCKKKNIKLPTIRVSLTAAMTLVDESDDELMKELRKLAVNAVLRDIVVLLDLVREYRPESLNHKWEPKKAS